MRYLPQKCYPLRLKCLSKWGFREVQSESGNIYTPASVNEDGRISGTFYKRRIKMGKNYFIRRSDVFRLSILGAFVALSTVAEAACTRITPQFTYSLSSTCGVPVVITFTNTSTGTSQNVATYSWRIGSTQFRSVVGKGSVTYRITAPGNYTFKLYATDTGSSPCRDSVIKTITITRKAPRVKDGNAVFTYSPEFSNCISLPGVPDTFGIFLEVQDTLKNYKIHWGDGDSATGTQLLSSQKLYKKYNQLGGFQLLVIHTVNGCSDTVRGTVVNERTPVAGLVGPPTGTNAGCGPLKVRFINNSNLSSSSSKFIWEWGDGKVDSFPFNTYRDTLFHTYRKKTCSATVKLTMRNTCGSSSTTWNPINAGFKDSAIIQPLNPTNCDLTKDFNFNNASEARWCLTPNPRKYKWLWPDGTSSSWTTTQTSIGKKFNTRGTFLIRLVDSNVCGLDTGKYTLIIDSLPKISSTATPKNGCPPLKVDFNDLSTGNNMSRKWDFGDPTIMSNVNTSTAKSPSYTYNTGGIYKAVLSVSNTCGTLRDTHNIIIRKKAKSGFTSFPTSACIGYKHTFNNLTVEGNVSGTTYKWIWEDGTTSTVKSPGTRTYNVLGKYTVMLIAYDSCGTDTARSTINITKGPTVTITSSSICQGETMEFTFTPSSDMNYCFAYWGDGTWNGPYNNIGTRKVTKKYDSSGSYIFSLVLVGYNGCTDTSYFPFVVNPRPTVSFVSSATDACSKSLVKFNNISLHRGVGSISNMSFNWYDGNFNFSNKTSDSLKLKGSLLKDTIYNIKLVGINSYGCRDSLTRNIKIYPKPLSRFSLGKNEGCGPLKLNTKNTSVPRDTGSIFIMKFNWDFNNGSASKSIDTQAVFRPSRTKDTIYQVRLIAASEHGCLDTAYQTVRVFPKPRSNFSMNNTSGCSPTAVEFSNLSTPYDTGSISIMKFKWDFGNKLTSVLTNPNPVLYTGFFPKDSTFPITLVAESEHGCFDTLVRPFISRAKPQVAFSPDISAGCGPLRVVFTNKSTHGFRSFWQFDDYGNDTTRNPVKTFFGRDVFDSIVNVKLNVISQYGCKSDTLMQKITVYGYPIAAYLVAKDTFCFPDQMQFLNQSLASYNYRWNLGDGTLTSTTNPKHFFRKSSSPFKDTTYNITLVALSPYGCRDTARGTMTVLPYPIPRFTVDDPDGCAPHTVKFTNNSVNVREYFWNFGDGYSSKLTNPTHTFINTGIRDTVYRVILYTYSVDCVDTVSSLIDVYKPSFSFFRTDRIDPCDAGYFKFQTYAENAASLLWKFGDGTSSTTPNLTHLFPTSPYRDTSFTVTLYSFSARGCTDSFKRLITLPQRLQIGMKDTSWAVCAPANVPFTNYTKGAKTFIWDFGDNGGSAQYSPVYNYQKPGIYQYKLYAFDANGCIDSQLSNGRIRVDVSPKAEFAYTPPKPRMPNDNRVYFKDLSSSNIPITYSWDFSDPNGTPPTSTLQNPTHDFSDSGNFRVRLVVNNGGCTDTAWDVIRVEPPFPKPEWIVDRDTGCPPFIVNFTNRSANSDRYIWFFGDGSRSEEENPRHIYKYSGFYDVTLIAKGPGGEGVTEKRYHIKVLNRPYTYFQLAPDVLYLPNAHLITRNLTTGSVAYDWSAYKNVNNQLIGTSQKFEPYFTLPDTGYYDVQLITVSSEGCYDTLRLNKPVYVNPRGLVHMPDAFTPNRDDKNDTYKPVGLNITKEFYTFQIFNRWGEIVFQSDDPDKGWDGTYGGKLAPLGVYAYKLKARLYSGEEVDYNGVVHLLR